jgi:hypothetical protein
MLGPLLVQAAQQTSSPLPNVGLIVVGLLQNGLPATFGLRSEQGFAANRFGPHLIGGVPTSIYSYVVSTLQFVAQTEENVRDLLVLIGDAYAETVLIPAGLPGDAEIAVVERRQGVRWLGRTEINSARAHNQRRFQAFHSALGRRFSRELA